MKSTVLSLVITLLSVSAFGQNAKSDEINLKTDSLKTSGEVYAILMIYSGAPGAVVFYENGVKDTYGREKNEGLVILSREDRAKSILKHLARMRERGYSLLSSSEVEGVLECIFIKKK